MNFLPNGERKRRVNSIVLDSAAVLAMIQGEAGGQRVEALLDSIEVGADVQVSISWVNWCEVLTRTQRDNRGMTAEELTAALTGVELVPFGRAAAELAAGYAKVNRALSLGDRACLALAKMNHATAWTADRIWIQIQLDVPVELIRP
jgi:PIN domain nuclease of toxin-antitoxin system